MTGTKPEYMIEDFPLVPGSEIDPKPDTESELLAAILGPEPHDINTLTGKVSRLSTKMQRYRYALRVIAGMAATFERITDPAEYATETLKAYDEHKEQLPSHEQRGRA